MIDRKTSVVVVAIVFCPWFAACAESDTKVPFPPDYRNWTVVKSSLVGPESKFFAARGGFHHFYANRKAMEGYRTGKFPNGSVIVDEGVYVQEKDGITIEGQRRSVELMWKDTKRYSKTGDWGFERFEGDNQSAGASSHIRERCFSCHSKQKSRDCVFSEFRK